MTATSAHTASRASNFTNSLGVNAHLGWLGTTYSDLPVVTASLQYLGVSYVRDLTPVSYMLPTFETLAALGIKFDLMISDEGQAVNVPADLSMINALEQASPGSVYSIEGPNELNDPANDVTFNGQTATNPLVDVEIMQAIWQGVTADPLLNGVQVLNASVSEGVSGWSTYQAALGNISSYVSQANSHIYFENAVQPATQILAVISADKIPVPGKPLTVTELGYSTGMGGTGWNLGGVDQMTQAKETLNALMDTYADGVSKTYLYELIDDGTAPPDDFGGGFGLFTGDGTPKLAATAIHDLTSILADTGSNAQSFTAGTLDYGLANMPSDGNSLLLEKSSGAFDLVIWAEPTIWNATTEAEIAAPSETVQLTLVTQQDVSVYDPLVGTAPVATYQNVATLALTLTDHPLVVEITAPPVTTIFGSGTGSATIQGTSGNDIITAYGRKNTIYDNGGSDTVTAGSGSDVVYTAGGNVTVDLSGTTNRVRGYSGRGTAATAGADGNDSVSGGQGKTSVALGNGRDTISLGGSTNAVALGSGNDEVTLTGTGNAVTLGGGNDIINGGGTTSLSLSGTTLSLTGATNTMAFIGAAPVSVDDLSSGTTFSFGASSGDLTLSDVAKDSSFVVDLTGGVGGYTSAAAVVSALVSDNNGGTMLNLSGGWTLLTIDFVSTAKSLLDAAHFKIG